jgi:hypothetical protein
MIRITNVRLEIELGSAEARLAIQHHPLGSPPRTATIPKPDALLAKSNQSGFSSVGAIPDNTAHLLPTTTTEQNL